MAWEEHIVSASAPAGADLSAHQYKFVKMNSSKQLAVCVADDLAIGILQDVPNAQGRVGRYCLPGSISKVQFGGSVTAGNKVVCDGNGRAVASGSADGNILGIALEGGASGGVYAVQFMPIGTT